NKLVHLIIIVFDVVITDWPVIPKPINTFSLIIIRPKPQRNSYPMVGSSAQHSGAKPVESRPLGFGVRFSLNFPTSVGSIKIPKCSGGAGSPSGRFPRIPQLRPILVLCRVKITPSFYYSNGETCF